MTSLTVLSREVSYSSCSNHKTIIMGTLSTSDPSDLVIKEKVRGVVLRSE